jgi:hypothetical protein
VVRHRAQAAAPYFGCFGFSIGAGCCCACSIENDRPQSWHSTVRGSFNSR